jgi:opacity protein-like surface antigen
MKLAALLILALSTSLIAQTTPTPPPSENYSGMYTFLQEGEFVQVTVEDAGRVTGFVSRYENADSDQKSFVDQFFKQGKLDGNKLNFTTETVHGVRFEFTGTVDRGEGKAPADEAYHVIKGTLTDFHTAPDKKVASSSRAVVFKSFPQDAQ